MCLGRSLPGSIECPDGADFPEAEFSNGKI